MNESKANGARRSAPQVATVWERPRMSVDLLKSSRPAKFECHDAEIPNITKVIYSAGFFSPVDTNLRRQWGRSHTAIVECDAEWDDLAPVLNAAGYTLGWA